MEIFRSVLYTQWKFNENLPVVNFINVLQECFLYEILVLKITKPNLFTEKLLNLLSYENRGRKMLIKLTPVAHLACSSIWCSKTTKLPFQWDDEPCSDIWAWNKKKYVTSFLRGNLMKITSAIDLWFVTSFVDYLGMLWAVKLTYGMWRK